MCTSNARRFLIVLPNDDARVDEVNIDEITTIEQHYNSFYKSDNFKEHEEVKHFLNSEICIDCSIPVLIIKGIKKAFEVAKTISNLEGKRSFLRQLLLRY